MQHKLCFWHCWRSNVSTYPSKGSFCTLENIQLATCHMKYARRWQWSVLRKNHIYMLNLWLQRVHTDLKCQYVCMCLCEHQMDNLCAYVYIYFSYAIHTLSLSPYYCIHIHIFMAQTHFGTLNVFLFNFTGPGWTNPCWIAPCLWMRSVVGCQTETNRSTWRESLGPSESPTTSECSMQVGCGRSGPSLPRWVAQFTRELTRPY